tara:strand:- start:4204 stop:7521 length:3318 start_codon:yes stop_codon:yes gene_type:complete
MSNVNYAELTLGANTAGLLKAKTDLAAVTKAGAATESSVTKSMQSTEKAISQLPNATAAATRGFTDLRTSLDPLYAASKQYEAAQGQVAAAVRAGAASQAEANSVLALAEKRYLGVSTAAKTTNSALKAASTGMNSFAFQSRMAAMQLSQVAQQTMAGGGFIRALSIQLPDLALGFGAVGIAAGVAGGILLPMAADLLTGADNAEELEDALDSVTGAYESFSSATDMARKTVSELSLEFGSFAADMQRTFDILQGVALERVLSGLTASIGALDVSRLEFLVGVFERGQGEIEAFNQNYNDALAEISERFSLTGSQAAEFLKKVKELQSAEGPARIAQSTNDLNGFLLEAYGSVSAMPPEILDMVESLGKAERVATRVAANVNGSADSARRAADEAAGLTGKLSDASMFAAQLVSNLGQVPSAIAAIAGDVDAAIGRLQSQNTSLTYQLEQGITASAAAIKAQRDEALRLAAANGSTIDQLAAMGQSFDEQAAKAERLAIANKAMTGTLSEQASAAAKAAAGMSGVGKATGGAGKAMKSAAREAEKLSAQIRELEFNADPLRRYNAELADLDTLVANGLSDGAYRKAVDDLNEGLAAGIPMVDDLANAFGDFIGSGLSDFKGFAKSILNSFTSMISQMVATAARNRILIGLGFSGGGVASQAAAGVTGGAAPGGGIFGSLGSGGTVGALTSGIGAGFNMALGGLTSGGLGGLGSVLSTQLGAATASVGAFGAALGAIALPLAGVAAVFSFFKKSVKELDAGLRITTEGMDSLIESFTKTETKRFWGLSKKVRTSYSALDAEQAEPLERVISELQWGVLDAAEILGIGTTAFEDFTSSIKISTKGLSETDAQKAIEEALTGFGDDFAGMVPGLEELQLAGEGAYAALERLSSRVVGVNASFDMLGFSLYELSLSGADAASSFVDLFGTLDDFNSITGSYYENFYSDAERIAKATQLVTDSLLDLGIDGLPATRRAFRELVEETEALGDDELLASLLKLSPAFAEITAATDALAASANALITEDAFATGFDYARSLAQAQNNLAYQPPAVSNAFGSVPRAQQDMTAELRGIRADLTMLQSTMQITAANTGRAADAADDTLAVTLENAL